MARRPKGEILIESGSSPSGTYHLGHIRELMTADAVRLELERRGRQVQHIHYVDDLDGLRKVPYNVHEDYRQYLGVSICDIPAPDGSHRSYAEYFLSDLVNACQSLDIDVNFVRSHEKYRAGFMVPAIERSLAHIPDVKQALEAISGHNLEADWAPIQVKENNRLQDRPFESIDTSAKTLTYRGEQGVLQTVDYSKGEVKLNWRLDWPGRWWLLGVDCEPSGRDHMTKGGSYDTGVEIMRRVYQAEPPYPIAYDFINMAGDTKKMSASRGTGLSLTEAINILPPEVLRYFIFRSPPQKRLYFDPVQDVIKLMDEFAALTAKVNRNDGEEQLLYLATKGIDRKTVSQVPFSLLVAAYQAALKDQSRAISVIERSEYRDIATSQADIIRTELGYIEEWLNSQAPDAIKFELSKDVIGQTFSQSQTKFLSDLANKVSQAPENADGAWFHQAIYELKDETELSPKEMFQTLYQILIGKDSGPRAGWFLCMLPRDWLIKRLRLEG